MPPEIKVPSVQQTPSTLIPINLYTKCKAKKTDEVLYHPLIYYTIMRL